MKVFSKGHKIIIDNQEDNNVNENELFKNSKNIKIDGNEIIISQTELYGNFSDHLPYTSVKKILLIDIGSTPKDKLSFEFLCKDNQYFFVAEENYLKLLNDINNSPELNNKSNEEDLKNKFFQIVHPKFELFKHYSSKKGYKANLSTLKLKNLLSYQEKEVENLQIFTRKHGNIDNWFPALFQKENSKKFYLILGEFSHDEFNELHDNFVLEENLSNLNKYNKVEKDKNGYLIEKNIAIIIHGLGSSINNSVNSYQNLMDYLENEFLVFPFEYLTINQTITDSANLLNTYIENLKQNYPEKKIFVFAHSMGGLVTRSSLVLQNAEVDFLLMAGTPNSGTRSVSIIKIAKRCFYWITRKTIKYKDYHDLMRGNHNGLKSLGNKTSCISNLNNDDMGNEDKYYCMASRYDVVVPRDKVIKINRKKLPSKNIITKIWNHHNYYEKNLEDSVGNLISQHKLI